MLEVCENEISLHRRSGGNAQLRTLGPHITSSDRGEWGFKMMMA